jgi:hypothetical protein
MRFAFPLGACVLLLSALPAVGQETIARETRAAAPRRMSDLLDATVILNGRRLGYVSDMTLTDAGAVRDLIVRTSNGPVVVPFSAIRYDSSERAYAVSGGITPRPLGEAGSSVNRRPDPQTDRWSRGGRLVRNDTPPPARIERVPAPVVREAPRTARLDFAEAARTYSQPAFSVSMTGNIDRLPARAPAFDGYTLPSEMYGWRSGLRLPPPMAAVSMGSVSGPTSRP